MPIKNVILGNIKFSEKINSISLRSFPFFLFRELIFSQVNILIAQLSISHEYGPHLLFM